MELRVEVRVETAWNSIFDVKMPKLVIGTINIQYGGNVRIQTAARCLKQMNVDLALLTETKIVNELSGGRVGYIYMPNTGPDGYSSFNRGQKQQCIDAFLACVALRIVDLPRTPQLRRL